MSANENVSHPGYAASFSHKGLQEGNGAEFFQSFPQQQLHYSQPQATSAPTQSLSMNPAFQPQGPPVFYNPMDYQKPSGNTLPFSNHQNTPWQQGQPPLNGMDNDRYTNQGWNQQGGYSNHYPNESANHGDPQFVRDGNHHSGEQNWHGQVPNLNPQYPDSWNYNNPQGQPHQLNYHQNYQASNPVEGQPGDHPAPHHFGSANAELDNESVSSGGGFSGFFNDRDEDDVDLVHPKGKETGHDSKNTMSLSGPDIIPAASQDTNTEYTESSSIGLPTVSASGILEPQGTSVPDLGQKPQSHGDVPPSQVGSFGLENPGQSIERTDFELNPTHHETHPGQLPSGFHSNVESTETVKQYTHPPAFSGDPRVSTSNVPQVGGVGDGVTPSSGEAVGMPEIVKQSSLVKPELLPTEGHNSENRPRTQSSDLISDIHDTGKGAVSNVSHSEGDTSRVPAQEQILPSTSPAAGDPSGNVPISLAATNENLDIGNVTRNDITSVPATTTESHPDLSTSTTSTGHISKPDITNINDSEQMASSPPTGPSSLARTSPSSSDLDTSHTSAFRTISGRHTPKLAPAINPSPPLWSTSDASVAGNILLAPPLAQPPIMPMLHPSPVKLQPKSQGPVSHTSVVAPLKATPDALGPGSLPNQVSSSSATNVNTLTQQLGVMQIDPSNHPSVSQNSSTDSQSHPPTSQPTFEFGKGYQLPPATSSAGSAPEMQQTAAHQEQRESTSQAGMEQSQGVPGQPTSVTQSGPFPGNPEAGQQPPSSQGYPPGVYGGPGGPPHQPPQQHPHAYPGYNVSGQPSYDPRYGSYAGHWDRYGRPVYGTRYDASGRPLPQDRYHHQYGRKSPYQQGMERSAGGYDYNRPSSRQGSERPHSRQGWGHPGADYNYQRYYKDREEYARRDDYYRQWYQSRGGWPNKWWRAEDYRWYEYYQKAKAQQAKNWTREGDQSGEWRNQTEGAENEGERTGEGSFASDFHHSGGGTPEQYGANQSRISDVGSYQQQSRLGYGEQIGDGSYTQGYDSYSKDYGSYSKDYGSYSEEYSSQTEQTQTVSPPPPQRMTPTKFTIAHVVARFSPGGHLIKVLPNTPADGMPATVEIHRVEDMLEEAEDDHVIEMKSFPGPLIRGETHKSDVIQFATSKAREAWSSTSLSDRASVALLWELMELLCRQNGSVLETDISELLLKDHSVDKDDESKDGEESLKEGSRPAARNIQKDTEQFRKLLLYGRKKESLDFAMKAGLWGHALLLAGKMDARTHASVMTRFANSLEMNDPLQTLYQLMSDRQPAAVTSCADEKWGDWRPHLAMILSNLRASDSEVGIKSITALGDSLATRGLLFASHFCYLMAQVGFGSYTHKSTKIVLLGSSHSLQFKDFATNTAIQLTEVYEYAQLLGNKHYLLPNFQAYKFLYATRLAEHGMLDQALRYCEVIAGSVQYKPEHYSATLVEQVCELADKLKYHDTQYYDGLQITEPQWLMALKDILSQLKDGTIQPPSKSDTPMPWVESYSNLSTIGGESSEEQTPSADGQPQYPPVDYNQPYPDQNQYYQDQSTQQWEYHQYQGQDASEQAGDGQEATPTLDSGQGFNYNQGDGMQQGYNTNNYWQQGYNQYNQQPQEGNLDLGASANSNFSEYSTTTGTETGGDTTDYGESMTSQTGFDYYGQSIQRQRADTVDSVTGSQQRQRTHSTGTPKSRSRTVSGSSNRSEGRSKEATKETTKQAPKAGHSGGGGGGGGGWFSGFFNKIRQRNGKEIHLPDDTSQAIVWDADKGKWVNQLEGDENDSGPPPPPPSDMELTKQQGPKSSGPPSTTSGSQNVNPFSKRQSRGPYVDVLNKDSSSSAPTLPVPSSLLPPMQATSTAPVNFYIPDAVPETSEQTQQQVANPDSEPPTPKSTSTAGARQFFNLDNFGVSNASSSSQQLYAPQQDNSKDTTQTSTVAAAPPVQGGPLMFNPSQMTQPASFSAPGTSKPSRYGARRQYPTQR